MRHALNLALRGLGRSWPNPAVGCVIVKNGAVVGRGWTKAGGRPHAETEALAQAGEAARGATAYVTLEPCAHQGQTPPCASALIAAGVARVVVACADPDGRVDGKGVAMLREAGIAVVLLEPESPSPHGGEGLWREARALNEGFFSVKQRGRPMVALKLATSLDGRIGTKPGRQEWITGEQARRHGQYLRAWHDAILTGMGTVRADDPELTCRIPGANSPVRIVLASSPLPAEGRLLRTLDKGPVWLIGSLPPQGGDGGESAAFEQNSNRPSPIPSPREGCRHIACPTTARGTVDLPAMLQCLAAEGVTRLLVEAGGRLATAFWREGLVDRLYWYRAPMVLGGDARPALQSLQLGEIGEAGGWRREQVLPLGQDVLEVYSRVTRHE